MRIKLMHVGNFLISIVFCITCNQKNPVTPVHPSSAKIIGYAQKGPLIPGSSISIQGLHDNFTPNNQTYSLTTQSVTGAFQITQNFESNYLEFRADAYFYNEVTGTLSDGPLTLRALATPFDSLNININVLTTLTFDRIVYLIRNTDKSFAEAREQAKQEVLKIFQIDLPDALPCDKMVIHREGDCHAALLAISAIILGNQKTSDVALFMDQLAEDFETDGAINETENQQQLLSNSAELDLSAIRSHLETYWSENDTLLPIPNFELYAKKILEFNIIGTVPQANATDIFPGTDISITLNKSLEITKLADSAIRLNSAQNEITGKIVSSADAVQIDFLPDSALAYNTVYTVTLADTLVATDRSTILPGYSWQFTTTPAPVLEVSPEAVDLSTTDSVATLALSNPSIETVHWQIISSAPCLTVEPDSGSLTQAGQNIRLNLERESLSPGNYSESLTLLSSGNTQSIPVRFEVPVPPRMEVSPSILTFGTDTLQKVLTVRNSGSGTIDWQITSAQSWINVAPASGSVSSETDSILVSVDKSELALGIHASLLTISSQDTSIGIEVKATQTRETLRIQADSDGWQDTHVWNLDCQSAYALESGICKTTNFGDNPELRIATGTWEGEQATFRTFIRFSPDLSSDVQVDSAILVLHADTAFGNNHMEVRRMLGYWEEESLDWDSQPAVSEGNTEEDFAEILFEESRHSEIRIDITGLMRYWQENPLENNGLRLSHKEEILYKRIVFHSSESPSEALRPYVLIYVNHING